MLIAYREISLVFDLDVVIVLSARYLDVICV